MVDSVSSVESVESVKTDEMVKMGNRLVSVRFGICNPEENTFWI